MRIPHLTCSALTPALNQTRLTEQLKSNNRGLNTSYLPGSPDTLLAIPAHTFLRTCYQRTGILFSNLPEGIMTPLRLQLLLPRSPFP